MSNESGQLAQAPSIHGIKAIDANNFTHREEIPYERAVACASHM